MKGITKQMNTEKIKGGRMMLRKMMDIFKGKEQGAGVIIYLLIIAGIVIGYVVVKAAPSFVDMVDKAGTQSSATWRAEEAMHNNNTDMGRFNHAARGGKVDTFKSAAKLAEDAQPPALSPGDAAENFAKDFILDNAKGVATAEPKVTGKDLHGHTTVTPADDGAAANGTGGTGGTGGGCVFGGH